MNVLITGGAGFIGRRLTHYLQSRGAWVRWLDNFDPQIHGENAVGFLKTYFANDIVIADVRDRASVLQAMQNVDAVVHLAAQTGTAQSMYRVCDYVDINVGGTGVLWDILANEKTSVSKVVVASSRSIYGEGAYRCEKHGIVVPNPRQRAQLALAQWEPVCPQCGDPISPIATPEFSPPQPASLYACTKLSQEQMSLTMGQALGIATYAFRFQNVFGPGQSLQNPYTGIISIFSNQLRQNFPIDIYEDGFESRDFVFVDDICEICSRTVFETRAGGTAVMNIGSGMRISVLELAHTLKAMWGSQSPIRVSGHFRQGDIRHNWADIECLRAHWTDWQATPLNQGLQLFVDWAQAQPIYMDKSRDALDELRRRNL